MLTLRVGCRVPQEYADEAEFALYVDQLAAVLRASVGALAGHLARADTQRPAMFQSVPALRTHVHHLCNAHKQVRARPHLPGLPPPYDPSALARPPFSRPISPFPPTAPFHHG